MAIRHYRALSPLGFVVRFSMSVLVGINDRNIAQNNLVITQNNIPIFSCASVPGDLRLLQYSYQ